MINVKHSIEIDRPVDEVFDYVSDVRNLPEWQSNVQDVRIETEGPIREGSRATEVRKVLGMKAESTVEIVGFEKNRRFDGKAISGPMEGGEIKHSFEGRDGRTRVEYESYGDPGGFFKLAEPLVERSVKRQVENDFETLKDIMEARNG